MKRLLIFTVLVSLMAVLVISCGQKADDSAKTETSSAAATTESSGDFSFNTGVSFDLSGTAVSLAGATFTPAKEWTDIGPSGMRKASYAFGPDDQDADSATITVFYFGAGQGGGIEDNLIRWVGQMASADGSNPSDDAKFDKFVSDEGMNIHIVHVPGTYMASSSGMMGGGTPKEGYIMFGAVLEAPEGNVFFKLTGPVNTAQKMGDAMIGMLKAAKKN